MSVQLVNDMDYITGLFNNLSKQDFVPVCLKSKDEIKFSSKLTISHKKNSKSEIEVRSPDFDLTQGKYTCYILLYPSFQELFSFSIKAIDIVDNSIYKLKLPTDICFFLNRKFTRYKLSKDMESSYIYIPFMDKTFRISDISSMGLSFESSEEILDLDVNTIIFNTEITIQNEFQIKTNSRVRYIKPIKNCRYIYGIQFVNINFNLQNKIFTFIFNRCYKQLEYLTTVTDILAGQSNISNSSIELNHSTPTDVTYQSDTSNGYNNISQIISVKNVHRSLGSGIAYHTFNSTFLLLLEPIPAIEDTNLQDTVPLLTGLTDALLNNPKFKFCFLLAPSKTWLAEILSSINKFVNDSSKLILDDLYVFKCSSDNIIFNPQNNKYIYRETKSIDITLSNNENIYKLEASCFNYEKNIHSEDTIQEMPPAQKFWEVRGPGNILTAFVVVEVGANEVNNICKIYKLNDRADIEDILESSLSQIASFYKYHDKLYFDIHIKQSEFNRSGNLNLNITGIEFKQHAVRGIMDFKGLISFKNFITGAPICHIKYYPLTYSQKSIWNIENTYPDTSFGNLSQTVKIKKSIDFSLLEQAINLVIQNNSALRTRLTERNSAPLQYIAQYQYKKIKLLDFSDKTIQELYKWDNAETLTSFTLIDSDLFYFAMLKIDEFTNGFYLKLHHIISDGWSAVSLITNQIIEYYSDLESRKAVYLQIRPQYFEYINEERQYTCSRRFSEDKMFWNNEFNLLSQLTHLKNSNNLIRHTTSAGRKTYALPGNISNNIKNTCSRLRVSPYSLFLTVFAVYLFKITSNECIIIGSPVLNRSNIKERNTVGMFVNTLPIKFEIKCDNSFEEYVNTTSRHILSCLKHQKYPYELIQMAFRENHKVYHNLYNVTLSYQNMEINHKYFEKDITTRWHFNGFQTEPLAIHISDRDNQGAYLVNIDYLTELFLIEEIDQMFAHLMVLLNDACLNPSKKLFELEILSPKEKNNLLYKFNKTHKKYPSYNTVCNLFETQVNISPDSISVEHDGRTLTYRNLNIKANQLAWKLFKTLTNKENFIPLIVGHSIDALVAILGVMKSGNAYIPLDISYPSKRIAEIIKHCNCDVIIVQNEYKDKIPLDFKGKIIFIDDGLENYSKLNLEIDISPENLAYTIYTSGSTGDPKGVMVSHKALINYILFANNSYVRGDKLTFPLYSSLAFDLTITSIFTPLISGNKIIIYDSYDVEYSIQNIFQDGKINVVKLTPSHLEIVKNLNNSTSSISRIIVGGENLASWLAMEISKSFNHKVEIYNEYGPTEATVGCMIHKFSPQDDIRTSVPIGTPADNVKIYLLDKFLHPVPTNTEGEIYIGGNCVARGYLNDDVLTKEKFKSDPFYDSGIIYKTGDLAKMLPEGEIEFLGRADNQIKIRGYRIEIGEIESLLSQYPGISEAVVLVPDSNVSTKCLHAYIVAKAPISKSSIVNYLSNYLPDYMIPYDFFQIDSIPLTSNGKMDNNALIKMSSTQSLNSEYIPPSTSTEVYILDLWKSLFSTATIGVNHSFFDLGGDSLKAIALIAKIHSKLKVKLTFKDFLLNPTISKLSKLVDTAGKSEQSIIPPACIKPFYNLSNAQKRIYMMENTQTLRTAYNVPFAMIIYGSLDISKLQNTLKNMISRHEILRTSFHIMEDTPIQTINDKVDFHIITIHISESDNLSEKINDFIIPFDLKSAPLLRVYLLKLNTNKYMLLIDMHHIISDEYTMDIMLKELNAGYMGENLPDVHLQYKDFSEWQIKHYGPKDLISQQEFWMNIFKQGIPVLNIQTDYPRPPIQSFNGSRIYFQIGSDIVSKLKSLCSKTNSTLYNILLAAYNILLYKYSSQEELVVGIPASGRSVAGTENIFGMFINTLPIKSNLNGNKTFLEFLMDVKESVINAFENQNYSLDQLIDELNIVRDTSRNPIFNTMFVFQSINMSNIKLGNLSVSYLPINYNTSKFDLTLSSSENGSDISFELEYCTDLFNKSTIQSMAEHFVNIVGSIAQNPDIELSKISMLSESEVNKILYDFNNTYSTYPREKVIHQLFSEQVAQCPDNVAIIFEDTKIIYEELDHSSNKIARYLRKFGIKRNEIVGIMLERSPKIIVSMLAILKSGAAYLPIDPEYPEDRVNFILEDSNTKIVISSSDLSHMLKNTNINTHILFIEDCLSDNSFSACSLENINEPSDLAYVIYTSGSTGTPKGVMIEHHSVVNFIYSIDQRLKIPLNESILCITTIAFDIFIFETLLPLSLGLKIIMANSIQQNNPKKLLEMIKKNEDLIIQTTPSRMQLLAQDESYSHALCRVKSIILIGEPLTYNLVSTLKKLPNLKLFNMYGPTETTVGSTLENIFLNNSNNKITIGTPISNTRIYIVDKNHNLQPIGITGEICISGDGVCRGYLNDSNQNKIKFVNMKFENSTVYKTGDLGRWSSDGTIEFLGRIDRQVKVRGYRIELAEIDHHMIQFPYVEKVFTILFEGKDNLNSKIYSYFVSKKEISSLKIRKFLLDRLPLYMIPDQFIQIKCFPLTHNGKIDVSCLPLQHQQPKSLKKSSSFRNKIDYLLMSIWKNVLKLHDIDIDSNFFELGGNSIKAMKVVANAYKYNWNITPQDIYKHQTIRKLSNRITKNNNHDLFYICPKSSNLKPFPHHVESNHRYIPLKNILLTGATGFLGSHILYELISNTSSTIYCIVRGKDNQHAENRLRKILDFYFDDNLLNLIGHRIFVINGDITIENMGLSDSDIKSLSINVDTIIHSAALVKYYGEYNEFENINVYATRNIINFCLKYNKKLNHISTLSIFGNIDLKESKRLQLTENELYVGQNLSGNVYAISKFEAEKLIISAINNGLNASIYRLGNLSERYSDGTFQKNINGNMLHNILRAIIIVGKVHESMLEYELEFTPIDLCSSAIIKISQLEYASNRVFHLFNHNKIRIKQLIEYLDKLGIHVHMETNLTFDEYISTMCEYNVIDAPQFFITNYANKFKDRNKSTITFNHNITNNYLRSINFSWPKIKLDYIEKIINYWCKIKFLEI